MDCRTILENASAYIDGELTAGEAAGFADHLRRCGTCAEDVRTLREASAAAVTHLPELELRPQVWSRVQDGIVGARADRPGFLQWLFGTRLRIATSSALILVALVSVTWTTVRQRQARHEIEAYMDHYIQQRRAHPPEPQAPASPIQVDETRNPFVDVDYSGMIVNPFMSEGK